MALLPPEQARFQAGLIGPDGRTSTENSYSAIAAMASQQYGPGVNIGAISHLLKTSRARISQVNDIMELVLK